MVGPTTNWAGNIAFGARRIHRPSSVDDLCSVVAKADRVRALGTGHSFNDLADTPGDLVWVAGLPAVMDIDTTRATVTVTAGTRYAELAPHLHANGFALANLGSLPHLSVAGACATATHGSGDRNGNLAAAVSGMQLVGADGELTSVSRSGDEDLLHAVVVGLGSLGIATSLTLDLVPTFDVAQYVYEGLPYRALAGNLTEILASGYSVSVFTDWRGRADNQIWLKRVAGDSGVPAPPRRWLGAARARQARHPVPGISPAGCTRQLGVPGPWHERLPHFRPESVPSTGQELQSEYFVERELASEAVAAVARLGDRLAPVLQVSEIRSVAADRLWLSPSYRRDSVAVHFTWYRDVPAVTALLAAVETQLAPLRARPHWGKLFDMPPVVLSGRYERAVDFRQLLRRFDPGGKFRNPFIDRYFPALP